MVILYILLLFFVLIIAILAIYKIILHGEDVKVKNIEKFNEKYKTNLDPKTFDSYKLSASNDYPNLKDYFFHYKIKKEDAIEICNNSKIFIFFYNISYFIAYKIHGIVLKIVLYVSETIIEEMRKNKK